MVSFIQQYIDMAAFSEVYLFIIQMVYDLMEREAASTIDSDEAALQEEEELLMQALFS